MLPIPTPRRARLLRDSREDLVLPTLVLAALDYWCQERLTNDAWLIFLDDLLRGSYRVEHPDLSDLRRARELQATYADLGLGVVDSSIVALTERLGERKLATLDHRHFTVVRPNHVEAFELLP